MNEYSLKKAGLLDEPFIPQDFSPSILLQVKWPQAEAQLGNELTAEQTNAEPIFNFMPEDSNSNSIFTILSFDPDAPSRENQEFGPWRHLILGGLKPKNPEEIASMATAEGAQTENWVEQTQPALSPWVAPSPGKGTGPHRYCFALYRETKSLLPMEQQSTVKGNERPHRRKFDVAQFAEDNSLELVGFNWFLGKLSVAIMTVRKPLN